MFIGALTAVNNSTVKEAKAMPRSLFQQELQFYFTEFASEANTANNSKLAIASALCTDFSDCPGLGFDSAHMQQDLALWNNSMLVLNGRMAGLNTLSTTLPYTAFSMDILLQKYDFALQNAVVVEENVGKYLVDLASASTSFSQAHPAAWEYLQAFTESFDHTTTALKEKLIAIGFVFTKAKLEFLEFPRLNCFPLQVAVAGKLYCSGQSVNGTATLQINNTQTGAMTMIGQSKADSFFDVFFEVTLPSSIGTGHWQAVVTDSGGAQASSFFDVFVTLPIAFEPTTIIPLTVLIAAVATLAVASRKVRRLN